MAQPIHRLSALLLDSPTQSCSFNKSPEPDDPGIEDANAEDDVGNEESEDKDEEGEQNEDAEDLEKGHQAFDSLKLNSIDYGSPKPRQQYAGSDTL
jgi:hypothetical protein